MHVPEYLNVILISIYISNGNECMFSKKNGLHPPELPLSSSTGVNLVQWHLKFSLLKR